MAFCTSCGANLTEGAKFCEACGASIADVPVAQPAPEPIPVAQPAPESIPVAQPVPVADPAPVPVAQPQGYSQQGYAQQPAAAPAQAPAHGMAVASLVLGIIGLLCCGICSVVALCLSLAAKNQGNQEGIRSAGFVLGCIGIGLWAIGIILAVVGGN